MIKNHFIRYFSSTMILKVMGIITMPIIIRKLSVEDYANYSLLNTYFSIFIIVMMLNFQSAISRFYFEYKNIKGIILGSLLISFTCYIVFSLLLYSIIGTYLEYLLSLSKEAVFILFTAVYLQISYNIMEEYFKVNEESKIVSSMISISGILTYLILMCLVFYIDNTSVSLVLSKAILLVPVNFICLYLLMRNASFSDISFEGISTMFKYSFFLMPYALSGFLLQQFDRVMLSKLGELKDVAYYSFAYSIGSLPYMIISVILISWNPSFMRSCKENDFFKVNYQSKLILIVSACIISLFMLFYKDICYLIGGDKYIDISELSLVILCSNLFIISSTIYLWFVNFKFKTYWSSFLTFISLAVNVLLNYILIPKYGSYAAAISTLVSYLVLYILLYIYVSNSYKNEFRLRKTDIILVILFFVTILFFSLHANLFVRILLLFFILFFFFRNKEYFSKLI